MQMVVGVHCGGFTGIDRTAAIDGSFNRVTGA
jgi:hypothetical protein